MIPIRDNIPSRTTPIVNYAILATCTLVFIQQQGAEPDAPSPIERYGMIPVRVMRPDVVIEAPEVQIIETPQGLFRQQTTRRVADTAVPAWFTLLTCVFLHGGWMHFLGNMWFLYIFGDNVEDRFGHIGYLLFYLTSGVLASLAHLATNVNSPIPTIGASGAIAGVMGAYFLLYPRAQVLTVIPIVIFLYMVVLPAPVFLGIWFLIQFFQGAVSMGAVQSTGVAWWAHIGGFAAGLLIAWQLKQWKKLRPAVERVLPNTERPSTYRMRRTHNPWNSPR
jgi:membrane associated rhomboid family serine protease